LMNSNLLIFCSSDVLFLTFLKCSLPVYMLELVEYSISILSEKLATTKALACSFFAITFLASHLFYS